MTRTKEMKTKDIFWEIAHESEMILKDRARKLKEQALNIYSDCADLEKVYMRVECNGKIELIQLQMKSHESKLKNIQHDITKLRQRVRALKGRYKKLTHEEIEE